MFWSPYPMIIPSPRATLSTGWRGETVLLSHDEPGKDLENLLNSRLVSPEDRPKIERHEVSRGMIKGLISMNTGISLVLESEMGINYSGLIYRELLTLQSDAEAPAEPSRSSCQRPCTAPTWVR